MPKHLLRNLSLLSSVLIMITFAWVKSLRPTPPPVLTGVSLNPSQEVADFTLSSTLGSPFTRTNLLGKWTILSFGFTHCPQICPTTLAYFRDELTGIPKDQQSGIQFVFVTVDPERDTVSRLQSFVKNFHPEIIGLTGDMAELNRLVEIFHAYFKKENPSADGLYSLAHSPQYYLINPQGRWQVLYTPPLAKGTLASDLKKLGESH